MQHSSPFNCSRTAACALYEARYPSDPPFHPQSIFPEYQYGKTGPENPVYSNVRELFRLLEMDIERYDTSSWNPLGELIRPGDKVVLKPNFLSHAHRYRPAEWEQVITHASIIRAVCDYVLIALAGCGEVWIADGPQLEADWKLLVSRTGTGEIVRFYESSSAVPVRLLDLRDTYTPMRNDVICERIPLAGDPAGDAVVDLAGHSRFVNHQGQGRFYGADYDQSETNLHHSNGLHEYRISKTVATADVFINLPKVKTHKKVGVTLCLKNLVGVNTGRNWLPHHTDGDPANGGDQFPQSTVKTRSERFGIRHLEQLTLNYPRLFVPIYRALKTVAIPVFGNTRHTIRSGNWHGNDTCWRMVHDINRVLLYGSDTVFPSAKPKRYFAIADGITGGDGDGPTAPDPVPSGFLLAGFNPVAVDCAVTRLMGFDPMKLAMLREAFTPSELPLAPFGYDEISLASNRTDWNFTISELAQSACFHYRPHFGWKGQIEWNANVAV